MNPRSALELFANIKKNYPPLTSEIIKMKFIKELLKENIYPSEIDENSIISHELFFKISQFLNDNYKSNV